MTRGADLTGVPEGETAEKLAEGVVTLWSNLLTLMGQHLIETGLPKREILEMLRLLQDTNDMTVRSAHIRAVAAERLMAVYAALETG